MSLVVVGIGADSRRVARSHLADELDAVAARVRVPALVHARRPPRDADAPRQAVLLRRRKRPVYPAKVGNLKYGQS